MPASLLFKLVIWVHASDLVDLTRQRSDCRVFAGGLADKKMLADRVEGPLKARDATSPPDISPGHCVAAALPSFRCSARHWLSAIVQGVAGLSARFADQAFDP